MVQSEVQLQSRAGRRAEASNWGDCGSDKGGLGNTDMPSIHPNPQRPPKLSSLTYDSPPDYLRTAPCPETCRVLFDYQPEAPDELALHKGDLVKVLRKTTEDKGWWEGECQGRRGVFPDNFVLPPPPVRKLIPRKIISRDSASIKESKKLTPRSSLPTMKKLVAIPSAPSKAKTSSTPSGDSQKQPSRDSGSNGSFLTRGPRQPGRKRYRNQASNGHSTSTQDDEQKSPGKPLTMNRASTPDKTRLPARISAPHKGSTPKDPAPEKAPESDRTPPAENTTLAKAATPEGVLSVDEAPAVEAPAKDEALEPKMALHVDNGPALVKILTPEHMVFEKDPSRDNTECQHLAQEEATQGRESLASSPNATQVPGEYPHQPNSLERCCCQMNRGDSSPAQSKAEHQSTVEEDYFLEGPPAKHEATPNEAPPNEELPSEGVGPQKQVPPKESVPTPQVPHTVNQIPGPEEEAPTLYPVASLISSKSKNGNVDIESLKEEVWSLKSALELLESKMEQKMNVVWDELKTEKEKLQALEVQMMQKNPKSFKHEQTQTE
ncbi:SH3 domain-containing protein 21 isoform X2 [Acomys russatus]|uniref:SH3 domain-containing protein 21 isoform X2 n=1 Tax=Acomys russatus TaxID=60746 RepID=UPI0021E26E17|nr:SH3 domain-containing protein 21 isoform X2 [Acomys russatus]